MRVMVVTDMDSGYEGLYVDGVLVLQDETIYAAEIGQVVGDGLVEFSHQLVALPRDEPGYPKELKKCLEWKIDNV